MESLIFFKSEDYKVSMCRADNFGQEMETFKPQIVLVCMGETPSKGWRIYRLIKALEPCLPVLVYRLAGAESVRDVVGTVDQALREKRTAGKSGVRPLSVIPALVLRSLQFD